MDCGPQYTCISDVDLAAEGPIGESEPINSVNDHPLPLHEDTGTCTRSVVGLRSDSEGVAEATQGVWRFDRFLPSEDLTEGQSCA